MKKFALALVAIFILMIVGGALWIAMQGEEMLRKAVVEHGPGVTGSEVALANIDLSLGGTAALQNLSIGNPEGFSDSTALEVANARMSVAPMSLLSDTMHIREIRIDGPVLLVEPRRGGTNLQALQKNIAAATGTAEESEAQNVRIDEFVLTGARIVIGGGAIGFSDRSLDLPDLRLENIGGSEGIPPAEAARIVFDALMPQVETMLASELGRELMTNARERLSEIGGDLRGKAEESAEEMRQRLEEETGGVPEDLGSRADETIKKGLDSLFGGKKEEEKPEEPPDERM